jgi:hypothetical protein
MSGDVVKMLNCVAVLLACVMVPVWFLAANAIFRIRDNVAMLVHYARAAAIDTRAHRLRAAGASESDIAAAIAREFPPA